MFSMMTVEDTAKPSKSRSRVAVVPQDSLSPGDHQPSRRHQLALLERGGVLLVEARSDQREAKRKPHHETGS